METTLFSLSNATMLTFAGIAVSLLVQFIKTKYKLSKNSTLLVVLGLSILGGIAYKVLMFYGFWSTFLQIIMAAGAFYTFIIKNMGGSSSKK